MTTADEKMRQELPRITEPDEGKIHYKAPKGLDQITLCGLTDFIGSTRGEETDKPINCWACESIASYCTAQYSARIKELEQQVVERNAWLAECYRQSGADPDGNEDWRLAPAAVDEVTRLRNEYDHLEQQNEQLQAQVSMLHGVLQTILGMKRHNPNTGRTNAGKWSHINVLSELLLDADHALSSTTQTAEAYKRRIQAEALEKFTDRLKNTTSVFPHEREECMAAAMDMASELKGE